MALPAGLSDLHPCATAQSSTVSIRCLALRAVSDLVVQIGVRTDRMSLGVISFTGLWPSIGKA